MAKMMKLYRSWSRPVRVCAAYIPILAGIFAWFWFASDGGRVDSSTYRSALYFVGLVVLPIGITAFFIHLLATLGTQGTLKWRLAFSLISGCLGVLALDRMIQASPDGEAVMMYIVTPIAFCAGGVAGFFISTLAFYLVGVLRKKPANATPESMLISDDSRTL
jgi:hypothetical protein